MILQSAGIMSPASSNKISPSTICLVGNCTSWPSRKTVCFVSIILCSFSIALPALNSCQKPKKPVVIKMKRIIRLSEDSPKIRDKITAMTNKTTRGLVNCRMSNFNSFKKRLSVFVSLAFCFILFLAIATGNPFSEDWSRAYNSATDREEKDQFVMDL